ncbi:MAG: hypothetical protein ACK5TR_07045 [Alphaproteobacteria bacterium]|jgi:hypothetical protein
MIGGEKITKQALWVAFLSAVVLATLTSVKASLLESEETNTQAPLGTKRKGTGFEDGTKGSRIIPRRDLGDIRASSVVVAHEEHSQAPLALAGEVIQDPSLGVLAVLPPEVLKMVFSYLEAPLVMREVSSATKAIVDAHVPLPVHIEEIETYLEGPEGNPSFACGRPVSLMGTALNLKKVKDHFPEGTIFRGGTLTLHRAEDIDDLPDGATAYVYVETQAQRSDLLNKGVQAGVEVYVLDEAVESEWQEYLTTNSITRLSDSQRQDLIDNKHRLLFLFCMENGTDYLDLFVQGGIVNADFDAPVDARRNFEPFDRLGSHAEKIELFSTLTPDFLQAGLELEYVFEAFMEGFASLPDHGTRLHVARNLTPSMMWRFDHFFMEMSRGFDLLVTLLAEDKTGTKAALMSQLNMQKIYDALSDTKETLNVINCLCKIQNQEVAIQVSQLIKYSLVDAFTVVDDDDNPTFQSADFEKMLLALADLPSQQARNEAVALTVLPQKRQGAED